MATKIFVNLPVSNLEKSVEFYNALGFSINPQFSDETAACMVISLETVDEMAKKVLGAGGKEAREPQDYGFMYGKAFEDPDGHIWEVYFIANRENHGRDPVDEAIHSYTKSAKRDLV